MRFARAVLWDEVAAAPARSRHHEHATDDARRRAHLVRFIEREFGEGIHRSPFDGRIGTRREIAFAMVSLPHSTTRRDRSRGRRSTTPF